MDQLEKRKLRRKISSHFNYFKFGPTTTFKEIYIISIKFYISYLTIIGLIKEKLIQVKDRSKEEKKYIKNKDISIYIYKSPRISLSNTNLKHLT